MVTEFCERVAYFGFAASLMLFFETQLGMSNATADVQYSLWSAMCYLTPLIGGYIADSNLNRYRTILVACCVYELGLILVVVGANANDITAGVVFFGIYLVALGCGGIKPNVSTLGADQFDERYSKDRDEKDSFFGWYLLRGWLWKLVNCVLVSVGFTGSSIWAL
jgi:peptide/histidine transporter 3/4